MPRGELPQAPIIELARAFGTRLREDEPLAKHCSFGVGGPADLFVTTWTSTELALALALARAAGLRILVLGSGANILPADAGFRGLVIRNVARRVEFVLREMHVTAESGVLLPVLARRLARAGLGGLEWGTGIPGTVGGATVNNAGAHGGCISQMLVDVSTFDRHGTVQTRSASELHFGYRQSAFKKGGNGQARLPEIVAKATFQVERRPPHLLLASVEQWASERAQRQPLKSASAGSFFQNPPAEHAGRLIELAGLKGMCCGGAQVSTLHANFIINTGGATAHDIFALGQYVRTTVMDRLGRALEMEVELVGDWEAA